MYKRPFFRYSSQDQVCWHCESFFGGPDGPNNFCWWQSKIKGTYSSEWALLKISKKRDEPLKMTHSSETKFYLGVVLKGEL